MKSRTGKLPRAALVALLIIAGTLVLTLWIALRDDLEPAGSPAAQPGTADAAHARELEASSPAAAANQSGSSSTTGVTEIPARATPAPAAGPAAGSATAAVPAAANIGPTGMPKSAGSDPDERLAPKHWRLCFPNAGGAPDAYELASDNSTASGGTWSARIRSRVARPSPSGAAICQSISAGGYRGQRVSITLHMRTLDAVPGAHMVFRADAANGQVVAFYNMEPAWAYRTTDWAEYSAVLDVPDKASVIFVGGALANTGTLWIDDAVIEVVDRETPVTRPPISNGPYNQVTDVSQLPGTLQNPGFEETFEAPPAR